MKPGGILCIVHKAAVWPKWQDQQDKFVASKVWEKVWINEEPVSNIELSIPRDYTITLFTFKIENDVKMSINILYFFRSRICHL